MEDARIKAGGGLVDRSPVSDEGESEMMTTSDYAKMKRGDPELKKYVKETREKQADFRKWLDEQVRAEFVKEMRFM